MARRRTASAPNIPLRLRRRRDGSLALTDATGAIDSDARTFPSPYVFPFSWLLGADGRRAATFTTDTVELELANAKATYAVKEQTDQGLVCELVKSSLSKPAPVDETEAEQRQAAREARQREEEIARAREVLKAHGVKA